MSRLLPDGSPPPPSNVREKLSNRDTDNLMYGSQSIGLNEYTTRETMVFDSPTDPASYFLIYSLVIKILTIKNRLLELHIMKVKCLDEVSLLL